METLTINILVATENIYSCLRQWKQGISKSQMLPHTATIIVSFYKFLHLSSLLTYTNINIIGKTRLHSFYILLLAFILYTHKICYVLVRIDLHRDAVLWCLYGFNTRNLPTQISVIYNSTETTNFDTDI